MTDLYEVLGVDRGADPTVVRKAYRRAAKKAHPDCGGSQEQFALVKLAHDCLTDEKRRATYDKTGRIEEPEPDSILAKAMNVVAGVLGQIMSTIDQRGGDYGDYDMLGDARKNIAMQLAGIENQIDQARKAAKKLDRAAAKMKARAGKVDRIGPMLKSRAADAEREAAKLAETVEIMQQAIVVLDEHKFEFSARAGFGW